MKILVLTNRLPFPLNDGGNKAVYNSLQLLLQSGHQVSLLSFNTSRHYYPVEELPDFFNQLTAIHTININNDINILGAITNLVKNKSYHLSRFIDASFDQKLQEILSKESFDIVFLEGLFITPYIKSIKKHSQATIIYRQHNIESNIWFTKSSEEKNILKRIYYKILANQLKIYEDQILNDLEYICPISLNDLAYNQNINDHVQQLYWPFTPENKLKIDITPLDHDILKIYHIGAMDWAPNQEAVDYLIEEIFPEILKKIPHAHLYIAGRNMPEKYWAKASENILILGEVEDSVEFQRDKHILTVPLKSASGQRIKFIEGLQLKKCIISTDVGKSDIKAENQLHYLKANTVAEFVDQVIQVYNNNDLYYHLCQNGYELYEKEYSFSSQKEKINAFLNKII